MVLKVVDKIQNIGIYKQSLDLKIQLEVLGQSLNKLQADNVPKLQQSMKIIIFLPPFSILKYFVDF
jgi:hypothetical protein